MTPKHLHIYSNHTNDLIQCCSPQKSGFCALEWVIITISNNGQER